MNIKDFSIERYFAKYEFTAKYLLSSSDCDGFPMQYVLDLASNEERTRWETLKLGYTETRGSLELRKAITQHYQHISVDNVVVSSPGEANFALMNVLLQKDDEVICMSPMYQSLYQVAKSIGCKLVFWQAEIRNNQWYFDPARLESLVTPKTKLIITNFPHNPTGYSPNADDWDAIIGIARKNGIALFSDEMYRFLSHAPSNDTRSACDLYENAISLWGTAKTFGLAGLRLGWLTSRNTEILSKVEAFKDYLSICNNAPSEVLATIALNNQAKFVGPNILKISNNLKLFKSFCERNAHFLNFHLPNSGSTAFVELKIKETAMEFAEKLVRDTGIMILPSETFDYGTKHTRIGFGRENFAEILGVFEQYIHR
ncbi:aminotransferase class I/II-fold pyridoxal phosphate-dependent enzyme [Haliscomenobacter sp.]|uniref:aminotransferase class I/II-fold pyridoxal phosphate-dependent enzyme n=1 Tax=Haliscomenobacter sp. TaxID=2717303 RepID=UPI00359465B3